MKNLKLNAKNKRGETVEIQLSAVHNATNFYTLKISAPFEIKEAVNGHEAITETGTIRDYELNNFRLKKNAHSQIILTPKEGTKNDRFAIHFSNNYLRV